MESKVKQYNSLYKRNLLEDIIPFWEKYSIDEEYGGYYTCLLRDGTVFDSDKFIWLQGRQAWMFSFLYNHVAQNEEWLRIAELGVKFLFCHTA
jgi:N-acylglucosamine 2-epimerase